MKKKYVSPEVMLDDATIEAMLLVTSPIPVVDEEYSGEGAARDLGLSDDDDI